MPRLALSKTYQLSLRTFEECRCPGDFLKGRQITWTGPGVQSQYERSTTRLVLLAHPVHYFRGQQRHTLLNKSAARSLKSSHEVIILSLQASDTLQARRAMEHKKRLSSIGERSEQSSGKQRQQNSQSRKLFREHRELSKTSNEMQLHWHNKCHDKLATRVQMQKDS